MSSLENYNINKIIGSSSEAPNDKKADHALNRIIDYIKKELTKINNEIYESLIESKSSTKSIGGFKNSYEDYEELDLKKIIGGGDLITPTKTRRREEKKKRISIIKSPKIFTPIDTKENDSSVPSESSTYDKINKHLNLQNKLKSYLFLKKYFSYLRLNKENSNPSYRSLLIKINKKMFIENKSLGITENNIHILNLFYEKNLEKDKKRKKKGKNILPKKVDEITNELTSINDELFKNMIDTPFENSMFFILAIFYAQLLEPDFKIKLEKYHKINKEYIDKESEYTIKNTTTNYSFINTCFHMVSLLNEKNQKKQKLFLELYKKYNFLIIIHLYAKFILKNMATLPTFKLLTDFELDDFELNDISVIPKENKILDNKLTIGKLYYLYLNTSSKHTNGILNCIRTLLYDGKLGTLNISKYISQIKDTSIDALNFYNNNNFGGNKKDNFCKNIIDRSNILLDNRINNLLSTLLIIEFEGNLFEKEIQYGGNIISKAVMRELTNIKMNKMFQNIYKQQIYEQLDIEKREDKVNKLKEKGFDNIIYFNYISENYTLQNIFNFKNTYILSFLFNLFLNHSGTKLTYNYTNPIGQEQTETIDIKNGSFKEINLQKDNKYAKNIGMVGYDKNGNKWILYCCTTGELNRLEILKHSSETEETKYKGGILSNEELIHLVFKKITFGDVLTTQTKIVNTAHVNIEKIIITNDKLLDKNKLESKSEEDDKPPLATSPPTSPSSSQPRVENIYDDSSFHKAYAFNQLTNMSYLLLKLKEPSNTASGILKKDDYKFYAKPSGKGWSDIKVLDDDLKKILVLLEDYDKPIDIGIDKYKKDLKDQLSNELSSTKLSDYDKITKLQDLLISLLAKNLEKNKNFDQHNEKGTMERISLSNIGVQSNIIEFAKAWCKEYPNFKNSVFEDVHGDNNCFYRAYLNGFLYLLLNKKGEIKIKNIERELKKRCSNVQSDDEECVLIEKLKYNIEQINEWFKNRDLRNPGEIYPGWHNVSLLMIYSLKYIISYSFKRIFLKEHVDLFEYYHEGEEGFKDYWDSMLDNRNDNYENYSKYGSNVWGDEQLLPLFKYFGINTYIIDISNMDDEINLELNFQGKNKWEDQMRANEEAIFLIKNGGHYKALYLVNEIIKQ